MTGDEYEDTGSLIETHILPPMRDFGIRYVQVARAGSKEADGIVVLDDSRQPQRLYLEGAYKVSDELRVNGTVPQFAGVHKCALKFKAFVIEAGSTKTFVPVWFTTRSAITPEKRRVLRTASMRYTRGTLVANGLRLVSISRSESGSTEAWSTTRSRAKHSIRYSIGAGPGRCALNISRPSSASLGQRVPVCIARSLP